MSPAGGAELAFSSALFFFFFRGTLLMSGAFLFIFFFCQMIIWIRRTGLGIAPSHLCCDKAEK